MSLRSWWKSLRDPEGKTARNGTVPTWYGVPIYRNGQVDGAALYAAMKEQKKRLREQITP